jgi:glyoxylase-like metal-dependent hydrolase (beta-lactamase superfamily II)
LPGRRSFFVADLRAVSFSCPPAQPFLGPQHEEIEDRARGLGVRGEPVVEMVAHGGLDHAGGLGRGEAVLGLAHEFRLAMKQETSAQPPPVRSSRVMLAAFLLASSP